MLAQRLMNTGLLPAMIAFAPKKIVGNPRI
jgi:hypothetical protein